MGKKRFFKNIHIIAYFATCEKKIAWLLIKFFLIWSLLHIMKVFNFNWSGNLYTKATLQRLLNSIELTDSELKLFFLTSSFDLVQLS